MDIVTKRRFLSMIGMGGLASALAACNTLSLFNTFTPKENNVRRIARDVVFGSDPRQRYDVYAPTDARTSALPILVFFYGGNWAMGSKDDYVWMAHALAAMGYVVALPDYRLVPEVRYPAFLEDGAAAVKHILANATRYDADPSRLALMGHSAGAYNAAMLTLDPRYLGDTKVAALVGVSGPYNFYPFDVPASRDAFGQWPNPMETQPVTYARPMGTHFLLMQSRADRIVGTQNAIHLDEKLRAAGDNVQLKLYDGLSHQDMAAAFSLPFRNKGSLYRDVKSFLAANL